MFKSLHASVCRGFLVAQRSVVFVLVIPRARGWVVDKNSWEAATYIDRLGCNRINDKAALEATDWYDAFVCVRVRAYYAAKESILVKEAGRRGGEVSRERIT